MAQGSKVVNRKQSVVSQRWDRFKHQLEKFKGGINASLVLSIALHVAKIVIGAIYIHDCPIDNKIPIFLIVAGTVGLVSRMLTLSRDFLIKYIRVKSVMSFIGAFEFIWLICGCVWVFRVLTPSYDPLGGNQYCHKTVYLFSLVYICTILAILALCIGAVLLVALCCCCCAGVLTILCPDDTDDESGRTEQ